MRYTRGARRATRCWHPEPRRDRGVMRSSRLDASDDAGVGRGRVLGRNGACSKKTPYNGRTICAMSASFCSLNSSSSSSSSRSMTASTTGALPFCAFSRFTALASRADPEGPALARPRRSSAGASSASRADAVRLRVSRAIAKVRGMRARAPLFEPSQIRFLFDGTFQSELILERRFLDRLDPNINNHRTMTRHAGGRRTRVTRRRKITRRSRRRVRQIEHPRRAVLDPDSLNHVRPP